jgi:hypothetical protein
MTDFATLEGVLKETLEERIIAVLSQKTGLPPREAMDAYYRSKLAAQIDEGKYGIHYLDAACLVDDLIENEPEILKPSATGKTRRAKERLWEAKAAKNA